nr:hypothetical protein Iba_chr05aCG16110 [Ipomoea batatas]GMC96286.1 hypothetical protein Iba_chr05cCG16620 [Ipomoea batatas]GMC98452.1 hypothetical protein Iba_chr05dCG16660 [Ipomoea batatas]
MMLLTKPLDLKMLSKRRKTRRKWCQVERMLILMIKSMLQQLKRKIMRSQLMMLKQRKRRRKRTRRSRIVEQPLAYSRVVAKKLNPLWL